MLIRELRQPDIGIPDDTNARKATMALCLTEETRSALSAIVRSRTAPAHHVERSAIILHPADRRGASETPQPWASTASGSCAAPNG
jgi:hypothetical protein